VKKSIKNKITHLILLAMIASTPLISFASDTHSVTLINHYNLPMSFTVGRNPDVVPDFPVNFTLNPNEQLTSSVLDIQKEAYIRGEDANKNYDFFGVDIENNATVIHGYLSKGIAYSWNNDTIIFCTTDEYKSKHHC